MSVLPIVRILQDRTATRKAVRKSDVYGFAGTIGGSIPSYVPCGRAGDGTAPDGERIARRAVVIAAQHVLPFVDEGHPG